MPKKKKKVENWRTSKGRELLLADVRSGTIHADMDDEEAFQSRPEFAVGESLEEAKRLFEGRLKSARGIIGRKNTRASSELALLREDRKVHPPPPTNHRGEPRWEGSVAQKLLKQDVAEKKHVGMKPSEFHQTRPEYQAYPPKVIKGHVEQEVRLQKFLFQYRGRYGY